MAECKIRPLYANLTELAEGDLRFGRMNLTLDEWHDIPTSFKDGHGGQLSLQLVPGMNFQVDLMYDGLIEIIDEVGFKNQHIYPTKNSIFHRELMNVVKAGHYRFKSSYPRSNFSSGKFSEAVKLTAVDSYIEARQEEVSPELIRGIIDRDDGLEATLRDLFFFVAKKANHKENETDCLNFSTRYRELENTGSFSGHCKEISTMTAGLANALGLRSKLLGSFIYETVNGVAEPRVAHSSAEIYIPSKQNKGHWLLVDPAIGHIYNSSSFLDGRYIYLFNSARLPKFLDTAKSAKIKVKYLD